jgi:subfamily B ATP-binding cassette protein MsbA
VSYWRLFAIGLLCTALITRIQVWFIELIGDVVNTAAAVKSGSLGVIALMIVGIHLIKWVLAYGQTYTISSATQRLAVRLRNDLYSHLQSLSLSFFERTKVGHLMSRMTNDVGLIQSAAPSIIQFVSAPLIIMALTYYIFIWNWKLAIVSVIALPLMSYTITKIGRGMRNLTDLLQVRLADVAAVVQETLSAMRIVKSFSMEEYENLRFADENLRTYGAAMRAVRRSAAMSPTVEFIGVAGIAFVLWFGGSMVVKQSVPGFDIGTLVKFLVALERIATSAKEIARLNVNYHQTMAGAQRIFDVLDEVPEVRDAPDAVSMPPIQGRVEFRDVSFAYDGAKSVLERISFEIMSGQQVALVGPSGAGKSTIANLIPRFYDVSGGSVLVDGIDVRTVKVNSLRKQIGIVPQESILFSSSIKENIAYGKTGATDEEIQEAAEAANAHEFIQELPQGYDTLVGERGVKLSGGERQRVAIARALLKNPKLLILDEATSSLDMASEAVVQEALDRLMQNRTTLVIAHRLSTVVNADRILVMQGGRIVESGTHQELLPVGGLYARLYAVQSKGGAPV